MLLEEYFDFLAADDIRLKHTRVGIETILFEYLFHARTPEEIAEAYPTVTLEQVYATILYYLRNRQSIDAYLTDWLEWGDRMRAQQQAHPRPIVDRLRKLQVDKMAQQTHYA